ncbi:MAG: DNA polymerase III subunit beta [Rickettsiaceae bacterium]
MPENIVYNLQLTVNTKDLSHALNFANSVVEKRNVKEELSNIKLTAKSGILEIGATDMDLYLNQEIGAEVISVGETTVSTQTLSEIVRKIPDSEIKITQLANSDKLEISGSGCRFELLTLPATQFPAMEDIDSVSSLKMTCAELARIIEYTNFSMSTEETRYNLNGVYMHVKDKEFYGVSTDGHRLSVANVALGKTSEEFGVIVPRKTINELLKVLKDPRNIQSEVEISLSTTKIKFKCNNFVLISKLIDGTFPEYSSFIPADNESKLTISTKLLADAIDRVATITIEKFRIVKLLVDDKNLEIIASGEAKGAASEVLGRSEDENKFCNYSGPDVSIGFNSRYLSDVLFAIHEPLAEIYFKDSFSPILIKPSTESKDCFVVMPVKA